MINVALIGLSFLLLVLFVCYLMSYYFTRAEGTPDVARSDLDPNYLDSNPLEVTALEPNDLCPSVIRIRRRYRVWSAWATRTYIAIVLSCAGVGLISQYPGVASPPWFGYVLHAFPFVSAFLLYKTWRNGEE